MRLFSKNAPKNSATSSPDWSARANDPRSMAAQDPFLAAEKSLLDKGNKLDVAQQAVFLQDLQALAEADRFKTQRLENELLWKGQFQNPIPESALQPGGAAVPGDINIFDDYHKTYAAPVAPAPSAAPWVAAGALALAGLGLGFSFAPRLTTPNAAAPAAATSLTKGFSLELVPPQTPLTPTTPPSTPASPPASPLQP